MLQIVRGRSERRQDRMNPRPAIHGGGISYPRSIIW